MFASTDATQMHTPEFSLAEDNTIPSNSQNNADDDYTGTINGISCTDDSDKPAVDTADRCEVHFLLLPE